MNIRLAIWMMVYLGLGLFSLRSRVWAACLYLLVSFVAPHRWWWGTSVRSLPLMDTAVIVMLLVAVLQAPRKDEVLRAVDPFLFSISALMMINFFMVTTWATSFELSEFHAIRVSKQMLVFNLMVACVRSEVDLRRILFFIVLTIGYLSVECQLTYTRGGRLEKLAVSSTQGSNQIGSIWISLLPLYLATYLEAPKWVKYASLATLPFAVNVILRTQSRAAMLGLVAAGGVLAFSANRRTRPYVLAGGLLGAAMFIFLLRDPELVARYLGLVTDDVATTDVSSSSRLLFWKTALVALRDNPGGFGGECWDRIVSFDYLSAISNEKTGRAVHQGFLSEALAWGVQGMGLLVVLQLVSIWKAWRASRIYLQLGDTVASTLGTCVVAGIAGLMVTCLFGDRQRYENSYVLFLLASVDYRLALFKQSSKVGDVAPAAQPVAVTVPAWMQIQPPVAMPR